jgi:hypothetical protein
MFSARKKLFSGSVLVMGALLFITGCSSPVGGNPAQEAADAFISAHAGALGKTAATVAVGDEAAVAAALTAYNALSAEAKALLDAEKTLLDSLKTKIDELKGGSPAQEAANAFKAAHTGALGKTAVTVVVGDEAAVAAALTAYNALSAEAKALLGAEKALLDSLKTRIDALKNPGQFTPGVGFGNEASFSVKDVNNDVISSGNTVKEITAGAAYYIDLVNGSQYAGVVWYINGRKSTVTGPRLALDTGKTGVVMVTVEAHTGNDDYDTGTFTFEVK